MEEPPSSQLGDGFTVDDDPSQPVGDALDDASQPVDDDGFTLPVHARTVYLHITVQCVGIRLQTKAGATAVKHPSPLLTGGGFLRVPQGRALAHPPAPHILGTLEVTPEARSRRCSR